MTIEHLTKVQRPRCWYFRSTASPLFTQRRRGLLCVCRRKSVSRDIRRKTAAPSSILPPPRRPWRLSMRRLRLLAAQGATRALALEAFFLMPEKTFGARDDPGAGEILAFFGFAAIETAAFVPRYSTARRTGFLRLADCRGGGGLVEADEDGHLPEASVVLGAAAPVPYRRAERSPPWPGTRISDETARRAASAAVAGAAPLEQERLQTTRNFQALVRRTILGAASAV